MKYKWSTVTYVLLKSRLFYLDGNEGHLSLTCAIRLLSITHIEIRTEKNNKQDFFLSKVATTSVEEIPRMHYELLVSVSRVLIANQKQEGIQFLVRHVQDGKAADLATLF